MMPERGRGANGRSRRGGGQASGGRSRERPWVLSSGETPLVAPPVRLAPPGLRLLAPVVPPASRTGPDRGPAAQSGSHLSNVVCFSSRSVASRSGISPPAKVFSPFVIRAGGRDDYGRKNSPRA